MKSISEADDRLLRRFQNIPGQPFKPAKPAIHGSHPLAPAAVYLLFKINRC